VTPRVTEIAPDVFRLSIYIPPFDLQFNHFLVRDEQPLLFHAGMRQWFPELRDAVSRILDPSGIRWVGFSHFEVDECGALNDWLAIAPQAQPICSVVGAMVNMSDFSARPARGLAPGETLATGKRRFRLQATPHLPHGWDAGMLFEETERTLFCSDLFHQTGNPEALTHTDVIDRTRDALARYQAGPLADYVPWTPNTPRLIGQLSALAPRTLAIMHGSSYAGDGAGALRALEIVFREVLDAGPTPAH